MRLHQIGWLAVAILLGNATVLVAGNPNVGDLTKELTGEKPASARTPEQLAAVYDQVLDALMPDLGNEDPGKRGGPQATLEKIAFRAGSPGLETDRVACSKAIAARLGPQAGPLARVWLVRQLERIGRAEAVPQLAKLLADQDTLVRESARRALAKNPAPEAGAALRQALGSAHVLAARVALINALGQRRDTSNLGILAKEATSENDDCRTAAVMALAKLGDKSAAAPIAAAMHKGRPIDRRFAADSYLRLAEALAAANDKAAALGIYQQMAASQGHIKCAGLIGIGHVGSASDLATLFGALADPDVRVHGACVEALSLLKGKDVTTAIAAKTQAANPDTKPALLQALTRRGDKSHLPIFVTAAADADEAVQAAALAGLGRLGSPAAVPLLLKAAATAGSPQEAARQSLQFLPGADIDQALLSALNDQDARVRLEIIRALAVRHVVAATQPLLAAAVGADRDVRIESLKALGSVAPTDVLPALTALLVNAKDDDSRREAAAALVSVANRDQDIDGRSEPIRAALRTSAGTATFSLLSVLGRIGGPKSLECLLAAVHDKDEKIQDAAIRALTEWPDVTAADDLLAIAGSAARENHRVLALRGYLRVCAIRTERPAAQTAKLLVAGLKAAWRPEEKRQALGALADVPDMLAFQAVVPYIGDKALKEEASSAAVRIARGIWNRDPEGVKRVMLTVLEVSRNDNVKRQARETLERVEEKLQERRPKK